MKTFSSLAIGVLFAVSFAPHVTGAPQFGPGRERVQQGRDRVCTYRDIYYQGSEQCYSVGDEITSLGGSKGSVSSIRIFGRARLEVFDATNFRGHSEVFSSDVQDLGRRSVGGSKSWNDRIESLRVVSDYYGGTSRDTGPIFGRDSNRDRNQQVNNGICVYDRPDYQGRQQCWNAGYDLNDLGREGNWSDRISSIRVFGRAEAVLYRDSNFRGESIVVDRDIPDLRIISGRTFRSWDRQVSSLVIESDRGGFPGRGRARGRSWHD
jgi:hypothetical protein